MKEQINKAIKYLKGGKIIIYPTETSYSFGCDAKNKKAVEKIHKIKKESKNKPIMLIVSNLRQIREFGIINKTTLKLCKNLKLGYLNLIIKNKDNKKYNYLSKDTIAFRISSNKVAHQLAKKFGSAITTTSVNMHKEPALYNIKKIKEQFKVDYIIDAGNLDEKIPVSTIYNTINNKIIRKGPITEKQIKNALNS